MSPLTPRETEAWRRIVEQGRGWCDDGSSCSLLRADEQRGRGEIMYRWHLDRDLMLRRWREEIAKHEYPDYSYCSLAPIPAEKKDDICHCYRGMGFLRKKSPYDCGNSKCNVCHYSKYNTPKNRNKVKNKEIQDNLTSWGIV